MPGCLAAVCAWVIFMSCSTTDAKTACGCSIWALTSWRYGENGTPMAGFPYHQLESYLGKLIAAGFRAAVCEQVEDPKLAKGLVKREVTRVVTPGTITDDALLDPRESNYLAAVSPGDPVGVAWVELSTGWSVARIFPPANWPISSRGSRRPNACWPRTLRRWPSTWMKRCLSPGGPAGRFPWKRPGRRCSSTFARTI